MSFRLRKSVSFPIVGEHGNLLSSLQDKLGVDEAKIEDNRDNHVYRIGNLGGGQCNGKNVMKFGQIRCKMDA